MGRVLLATFGSLGDLHPYLAVGRALQAAGHQARIATSSDYEPQVRAAGLAFAPVAPSLAELGSPAQLARVIADPLRGTRTLVRDLLMPHLRDSHRQLTGAAADADLLISHPLTFMLQVVAQEARKPWLSTVLAPTSFLSREDPPVLLPINSLQIARRIGPWAYDLLMGSMRRTVRGWEQPLHEYRRELGLPPTDQIFLFEGQFSPLGTLALFDAPLMRPQADWPVNTQLCGTPLYDGTVANPQVPQDLLDFLACGEAPIVFALGSSAVWLGQDFWPAAIEAAQQLGRRAILVTGGTELSRLPPQVRVFNYLPYSQLFPHACAVVHQAGIGTLSQALRAGRPQLITPVWFDQPDNAQRAQKLGVARTVPFKRVTGARLARELRVLLQARTYADTASELAATLKAVDGAATAAAHIAGMLRSMQ